MWASSISRIQSFFSFFWPALQWVELMNLRLRPRPGPESSSGSHLDPLSLLLNVFIYDTVTTETFLLAGVYASCIVMAFERNELRLTRRVLSLLTDESVKNCVKTINCVGAGEQVNKWKHQCFLSSLFHWLCVNDWRHRCESCGF